MPLGEDTERDLREHMREKDKASQSSGERAVAKLEYLEGMIQGKFEQLNEQRKEDLNRAREERREDIERAAEERREDLARYSSDKVRIESAISEVHQRIDDLPGKIKPEIYDRLDDIKEHCREKTASGTCPPYPGTKSSKKSKSLSALVDSSVLKMIVYIILILTSTFYAAMTGKTLLLPVEATAKEAKTP